MNSKESVFDELPGDGDKEKKETKWQIPEAWEADISDTDWIGVPKDVGVAMMEVGENPDEILRWGIDNRSESGVIWALENGADINKLSREMLKALGWYFSPDFAEEIATYHIIDEGARCTVYLGMIIGGMWSGDKYKIRKALDSGLDMEKLESEDSREWLRWINSGWMNRWIRMYPANLLKRVIENFITDEGIKQIVYETVLKENIMSVIVQRGCGISVGRNGEMDKIIMVLRNRAGIMNQLERQWLVGFGKCFPTSFVEEVVKNYVTDEDAREAIYSGMLEKRSR